jgi:translocator protein
MSADGSVPARGDSTEPGRAPFGRRRRDRLVVLVASVAGPLVLGGAGGAITARAIPGWYAGIAKPSWNPPSWLFGPVWTVLYIAMGIAAWRVWRLGTAPRASSERRAEVGSALRIYGAQLALNASWTPVFFGLRRIGVAFAIIAVLLGAIVETLRRFSRLDRAAALLLVPYLGWVAFATALNGSIWLRNR